eukprot:4731853-Pleurochrysis_carterae.AAC.1
MRVVPFSHTARKDLSRCVEGEPALAPRRGEASVVLAGGRRSARKREGACGGDEVGKCCAQ